MYNYNNTNPWTAQLQSLQQQLSQLQNQMTQPAIQQPVMQNMIKKDFEFTPEKAEKWTSNMVNEDGTKGAHWNIEQTNQFKPQGIEDYVWNATLNMVYSDYYSVAVNNNVNTPEFYVGLAKAFLFDKDALSPKKKIAAYYNCIVDTK